LLKQSSD